jgi:hypothetical protein
VKTPTGAVFNVPVQNLAKFQSGIAGKIHVMSDAEIAAHASQKQAEADEQKYGGLGYQAEVAGTSALGAATFGLSDMALSGILSEQQKKDLEKAKKVNPVTNVGAGIVGAVVPTLLTGGAAAPEEAAALGGREVLGLAKGAETLAEGAKVAKETSVAADALGLAKGVVTGPTRALDAVGNGVSKGISKVIGSDAQSVAGQLAQRSIANAGGDAVAAALGTAGQTIGENMLSTDHSLTGEQLVQHMGIAALLGGGAGALFATGGQILDRLGPRIDRKADETLVKFLGGKNADELRDELERVADKSTLKELRADLLDGQTGAIGKVDRIQDVAPKLETYATTQRANLVAMTAGAAKENIGTLKEVFKQLYSVKDKELLPSLYRGKNALEGLKEDIGKAVGFEGGTEARVITSKRSPEEIREYLKTGQWDGKSDPSIVKQFVAPKSEDEALAAHPVTLHQAQAISNALAEKAHGNPQLLDFQSKIDGLIHDKLVELGLKDAAQLSRKVQAADVMATYANKTADALVEHEGHGLGEALGHAALGAGLHSVLGGAAHHAASIMPGGLGLLAAHEAGKVAKKIVKERGQATAVHLLDALSSARTVQMAQRKYARSVRNALDALYTRSSENGSLRGADSEFAEKQALVKKMLADPQTHAQIISGHASQLGPAFSTVGSAFERTALSQSVFLAQQLPRPKPLNPLLPKAGTIPVPLADKAKFNGVFEAVKDPTNLIRAAANGTLTKDMVSSVATTQPSTLKDLQGHVSRELATLKEPLAPHQMAALKMILGQPVFDHPIQVIPQAPQQQGGRGRNSSNGGRMMSKPLKIDVNATTGLPGSRIPRT